VNSGDGWSPRAAANRLRRRHRQTSDGPPSTYEPYPQPGGATKPESGKLIADSLQYPMVFDTFGLHAPSFIKGKPQGGKGPGRELFPGTSTMIAQGDKTKAFTHHGRRTSRQTAEQFREVAVETQSGPTRRKPTKKFFNGEIQALQQGGGRPAAGESA